MNGIAGASNVTGDLTLTAGGVVTDSGTLDVSAGTTDITVTSGDITLADAASFSVFMTSGKWYPLPYGH